MKSLFRAVLTMAFFLGVASSSFSQSYGIRVETVAENIGVLTSALGDPVDLTGHKTYRLYATAVNADDFVSAVYGNADNPTDISTTTNFFQSIIGGATAASANPLLFAVYPDLEYDSWFSIGLEGPANASAGEEDTQQATSPNQNFSAIFDPGAGADGGNLVINDMIGGTWFVLNTASNGIAGADLEVLIGQFTTDGEFSGEVNIQFFEHGAGGATIFATETFSSADAGCTSDEDGDGVCDEDEIPGCTDATSCNYNDAATDDDSSCTVNDECGNCGGTGIPAGDCDCDGNQNDALGVCGGPCEEDVNNNGVCDDEEDCLGTVDACGVCDGPGAIYDCGCSDMPADD
jgi:hypothetical protein